jgi:hypothetical protein
MGWDKPLGPLNHTGLPPKVGRQPVRPEGVGRMRGPAPFNLFPFHFRLFKSQKIFQTSKIHVNS